MITIVQTELNEIVISLSSFGLTAEDINLQFVSPSRDLIELNKSLTSQGSGFYSFQITIDESNLFIDDTYSYYFYQGIEEDARLIKHGRVRLIDAVDTGIETVFDYTLDFLLS